METKENPKYLAIAAELRKRIYDKDLKPHDLLCTEMSICEQYNVSRITAKRAIKMLEDEDLIYRRKGAGSFVSDLSDKPKRRGVSGLVPQNIALVIPFNIARGGLFKALAAGTDILSEEGYFLSLHVSGNEKETLTSIQSLDMRALVYYPVADIPVAHLDYFVERKLPVIILDKPHEYPQYSAISCDNRTGQALLCEHVLAYGHQKTAYLSRFTDNLSSIRERFYGYVDALEAGGGGCIPRFVKLDEFGPLNYDVLRHIIITLRKEGISALLCENDEVAFYVLLCCQSLGIRVPEDMSVTGFDNIEWAVAGEPRITTIDQNFSRIGAEMAKLLTTRDYTPKHIKIPVTLVPRSSTGRLLV